MAGKRITWCEFRGWAPAVADVRRHDFALISRDQSRLSADRQAPRSCSSRPPLPPLAPRPLTDADAVDIWIARWLRVPRTALVRRYSCDPRRLYEIWCEERFPGSRVKAVEVFARRHPRLVDRIDHGRYRRLPLRTRDPQQLGLFD